MTDRPDWARIESLFHRALELPAEERAALLERAAATDPDIAAEVRSLLAAHERAAHVGLPGIDDGGVDRSAGDPHSVGPYRIVRGIGRGGMGVVYLAERDDEQFRQRVALKLLRSDQAALLHDRFLREREILAGLSHPNIATLYDGGITDEGLPWFAMELVEGVDIEEFCADRHLDADARLRLFSTVCDAVQYAHQNLVVHRDLKPNNLLVTADGVPKLLDFGIAKLLEDDVPHTETADRRLTPKFAAPEQIVGGPITTATDTYTLGVMLYRLLVGAHPYDVSGSLPAVAQAICGAEPVRPSLAAGGGGDDGLPSTRRLRGDLDTILLKALRKEPERRYQTAGDLATDLRRHLAGRPVSARPDTLGYRLSKLVRRHRVAAVAAGLALLTALGGTIGIAWQARRASAQARAAEVERDRARIEARRAEETTDFLAGLLAAADPREALGRDVTVRELVERGAERLMADTTLADEPLVKARMLDVLGDVFDQMSRLREGRPLFERAIELRRENLPPDHPDLAESLNGLAALLINDGDLDAAEPLLQEALAIRRAAAEPQLETASTLNNLAAIAFIRADYAEAGRIMEEAIGIRRELGDLGPALAINLDGLAGIRRREGRLEDAERLHEEALEVRIARLDPRHPDLASSYNNIAGVRMARGDAAGAEPAYRQALEIMRSAEPEHHLVASILSNLGSCLEAQDRPLEAEAAYRESLDLRRRIFGDVNGDVAISLNNLGLLYARSGRLAEARPPLEESLRIRREVYAPSHPNVATALHNLAFLTDREGDGPAAGALYRQAWEIRRRALGESHDLTRESEAEARRLGAIEGERTSG